MYIKTVEYELYKEDFPLIEEISKLKDERKNFFIVDYKKDKEYRQYQARACNQNDFEHNWYWVEEFLKINPDVIKIEDGYLGALAITTKKILTRKEQELLKQDLYDIGKFFMQIKHIQFDITSFKLYKHIQQFENGNEIMENWLFGHFFNQLKHNVVKKDTDVKKIKNGVYEVPFSLLLKEGDVDLVKDRFDERFNSEIEECMVQDCIGYEVYND